MTKRILLASLTAGLAVLACTEGTAPLNEPPAPPDAGPHFVKWDAANGPVRFSAVGETPHGALDIVHPLFRAAGDSIQLDTYEVSFWAVRGERRYIQINYVEADGSQHPYIRLDVANPTQRPDGSPIAMGDSVPISVSVDPTDVLVHFGPSGLQFGTDYPTTFQMWYGGATDDLNLDGTVNSTDSYIQYNLLGMWYHESAGEPWEEIDSRHDPEREWFGARLQHFSGYAISW
jgi:hypothetical protein